VPRHASTIRTPPVARDLLGARTAAAAVDDEPDGLDSPGGRQEAAFGFAAGPPPAGEQPPEISSGYRLLETLLETPPIGDFGLQ